MSAGPCDTGCESLRIAAGSHGGATVDPMPPHLLADHPTALAVEKRVQCGGETVQGRAVCHKSAITPPASGRVRASHQVLNLSAPDSRLANFRHPWWTTPTLDERARAQRVTGDSTMWPHHLTPRFVLGVRSEGQYFQGGGTGSNPVGGAQRFPSSAGPFRSEPAARATAAITLSITVAVPARPTASRTDGDCPAGSTVERSRPSRPLDIENARKPHRPRAAQTTCRTPYARMGTSRLSST